MPRAPFAHPIHACLLDLDGTLVDTLGDFEAALNAMLAELGLPHIARAQIERLVGKGSEHLIRSVLALQGADAQALYERAWAAYQGAYLGINGRFSRVYPGVPEGLRALQGAGLPLVCLTNKPLAFARPLLAAKGLAGFFRHVYGGDSFARKKPDPLPLIEACRALGSAPARTLMVGDSRNDAEAAHAAGCPLALVRYGYNHGEPIDAVPAAAHLDRLDQLPGWLVPA
jgi:phosphoglycolate phosphatase